MRVYTVFGVSWAIILGVALAATPARAERAQKGFAPIPPDQTGGMVSGLELRIVRYDGATNGVLEVEVKNGRSEATVFSAKGLYFVPNGNANEAPQRLGAVGPFNVKTPAGWQRRETLSLASGDVARLKLDVYCIDSHRASPGPATGFHIAKDRVPARVSNKILESAAKAAEGYGGVSSPSAKSAVQQQVWKNRDDKWVPLDGEGQQEAGKR